MRNSYLSPQKALVFVLTLFIVAAFMPANPANGASGAPTLEVVREISSYEAKAIDHDVLYAALGVPGSRRNELFRSFDKGQTWQKVYAFPSEFLIHPLPSGTLIASTKSEATGQGYRIWRSTDQGLTWNLVQIEDPDNRGQFKNWLPATSTYNYEILHQDSIVADGTFAYLGTYNNGGAMSYRNWIYRSSDDGLSWRVASESIEHRHIHSLEVNPYDGRLYIAFGDSGSKDGIFVSSDQGQTIKPICSGRSDNSCILVDIDFTPEGYGIWGTDSPYSLGKIGQLNYATGEVKILATVPYESFSSYRLKNGLVLVGETYEPAGGIKLGDPNIHLWAVDPVAGTVTSVWSRPIPNTSWWGHNIVMGQYSDGTVVVYLSSRGTLLAKVNGGTPSPPPTPTPPANTSPPTISGTPQSGQTLNASPGTWSGNPAPNLTYQWQSCTSGTCNDIPGATSQSYAIPSSDIGKSLRVKVTGTNSTGSVSVFSSETAVITDVPPPPPPTNNLAPNPSFESDPNSNYYTNGDGAFSWANDAFHSGTRSLKITTNTSNLSRWMTNTYLIPVTPGKTYNASAWIKTNGSSAYLTATFWGNGGYTGAAASSLSANGDWKQVFFQVTAPQGATAVRLEFRYTGPGSAWMDDLNFTDPNSAPTPPANTSPPSISGTSQSGQTLTASPGTWSGTTFTYQWQSCVSGACTDIPGATSQSYTATTNDSGKTLRVKVTGTNSAGSTVAFSSETPAVVDATILPVNNLAPNPSFESDPNTDYYTHGTASFSWAADSANTGSRSLKIVSTSPSLTRWMSQTYRIPAVASKTYFASVWLKTLNAAGANLSLTFWGNSGYLGSTYTSEPISGTQNWTQINVQGQAPAGTTAVRPEFRLNGGGTVWFDGVELLGN